MVAREANFFVIAALVLAGCAYKPDSFRQGSASFRGFYISVDCLDLGIDHRKRDNRMDVIAYEFGNRCDKPVVVDLAAARVYGRTADGEEVELYAFDPMSEIRPVRIDARAYGREAIEYPSSHTLDRVCIDAAAIAHVSPPNWICFNRRD
ncbi:MAG TPA: hypothetical protein VIV11_15785 [Kofleriaceae bacterium]